MSLNDMRFNLLDLAVIHCIYNTYTVALLAKIHHEKALSIEHQAADVNTFLSAGSRPNPDLLLCRLEGQPHLQDKKCSVSICPTQALQHTNDSSADSLMHSMIYLVALRVEQARYHVFIIFQLDLPTSYAGHAALRYTLIQDLQLGCMMYMYDTISSVMLQYHHSHSTWRKQ